MKTISTNAWWQGAVIYQIYPRSFQDTNGDGIGDLKGITERLDYLVHLGVDALWLSPFFESPMYDFGYDISDYRSIDPVFGSMDDFKELLREAGTRGIRIILDGVFNHTSHKHPWFLESKSSKNNPKRDWYIWKKKRNNWLSIFGGSAWQKDSHTGEFYLHSFLKEQPDLNWHNPEVKQAVFNEIRYWLDMGVSGFRFDVINFFYKDAEFRNNPLGLGPTPRPYDLQKHIYDRNRPELHQLLKELRQLLDGYDAMMVGEIFSETQDAELSASYLGSGDELHLSFDFSLMYTKWSASKFHAQLDKYHKNINPKAWPCTVLSNHDQPRSLSRFGKKDANARAKILAVLSMTMRGTPFLYYGEEIGMKDLKIKRKQIVDPVGRKYWPFFVGRDPARSPMQWSTEHNAGFSKTEPWLPVGNFDEASVEGQIERSGSLLNLYSELIALRKQTPDLLAGDLRLHPMKQKYKNILMFDRGELTVILNFSSAAIALQLPDSGGTVKFSTHRKKNEPLGGSELVSPYEAILYLRKQPQQSM